MVVRGTAERGNLSLPSEACTPKPHHDGFMTDDDASLTTHPTVAREGITVLRTPVAAGPATLDHAPGPALGGIVVSVIMPTTSWA